MIWINFRLKGWVVLPTHVQQISANFCVVLQLTVPFWNFTSLRTAFLQSMYESCFDISFWKFHVKNMNRMNFYNVFKASPTVILQYTPVVVSTSIVAIREKIKSPLHIWRAHFCATILLSIWIFHVPIISFCSGPPTTILEKKLHFSIKMRIKIIMFVFSLGGFPYQRKCRWILSEPNWNKIWGERIVSCRIWWGQKHFWIFRKLLLLYSLCLQRNRHYWWRRSILYWRIQKNSTGNSWWRMS